MISIIVPIYKVELYIHQCINSILAQTYADFELILIDDGSPDNCGVICDEYAKRDDRIRVIHQENAGVSAARNAGIEVAKGEFICFVDSDDYVDKDYLELVLETFTEDVDWVCFGYRTINILGTEVGKWSHEKQVYDLSATSARGDFIAYELLQHRVTWEVWNKVFRRSIIIENGVRFIGDCEAFAEDQLFCACYGVYSKRVLCIPDILYNYVLHANSIMANRKGKCYLRKISCMTMTMYCVLENSNCAWVMDYFPLFYYLIMNNEMRVMQKEMNLKFVDLRNLVLSEVSDRDFFFKQLKSIKTQKKTLYRLWGKATAEQELSAIRFLIDGNYTAMRIRSRLISLLG